MINLTLTEKEISVLKKSIDHCLQTCKEGGPESDCSDCKTLEEISRKIVAI